MRTHYVALALSPVLLLAFSAADAQTTSRNRAASPRTPAPVQVIFGKDGGTYTADEATTPVIGTLSPAGEGRRAYLKYNCYSCHGMAAGGGMGPNITEGDDVREAVMEGRSGGMPSFRNIVSASDISNLTAYLRAIGTADEPKFNDWWKANPKK